MTTGIFFIQVFGFLLQTYPIAILSFVSFSQEELLFPRKKLYLCLFFGMSLISYPANMFCLPIRMPWLWFQMLI